MSEPRPQGPAADVPPAPPVGTLRGQDARRRPVRLYQHRGPVEKYGSARFLPSDPLAASTGSEGGSHAKRASEPHSGLTDERSDQEWHSGSGLTPPSAGPRR